ncbi:MAG: PQQ-dependent sugar dehydrogenase [Acidobacteria bacterium]|nr:PQQ-dependent sugar dehydrogenase [Acidobacteriota bacterium]
MRPWRSLLPVFLAIACVSPAASAQLRATLVASGFDRPVAFIQHPTDPTAQIVVQQWGRLLVLKQGSVRFIDFLTLTNEVSTGGEQGVLGLAFAPDYAVSRRVFVSFTNRQGHSVISRYRTMTGDDLRIDAATRFDLRWPGGERFIRQPFVNHNGGQIAFGSDGYLYLGLGDGGSGDDPFNHAQTPSSLLGKMLRLDVSVPDADPEGYDVPPGNPFVGHAGVLPEIWALGLRNPWRWSFDDVRRGGTGALIIGDVGQGAWEEVDYQPADVGGLNYGWRNREGAHQNIANPGPASAPLQEPIWEYPSSTGRSVIGGYVYRGRALGAAFVGRYFVGDFVSSRIWSLELAVDPATRKAAARSVADHTAELGDAAASPSSFGVDADGELYVVSLTGSIYRLEGPPGQAPAPPPSPTAPGQDGPRRQNGDSLGSARKR